MLLPYTNDKLLVKQTQRTRESGNKDFEFIEEEKWSVLAQVIMMLIMMVT
jgi:hypothetical protein